ncbi:aspartate aminotransferase family protein [Bradyrhizobium neotropicale]|uniref:aspartate aminotransferase family protein n=1 Tax=Bradyrhizobium neotropicale TaxID=1497615 RepID=UPI001AD77391|nr:aspartate aminotransferase family protein [Bradyrhizobium neotropicale]MBO4227905.1 aminotransferase class III-fold pyridoxal phosphate-dependent enzyme [Bradyrhizobium neotropicale]
MYPDNHRSSRDLYQRALKSLPGGNTRTTVFMKPFPIYAARGAGCRVWDLDGNEYIDCINNFTSLIHGHAHPVLIEAATKQLARGSAFGMPTESEVDLAELLAARLPSVEQARFANSGTEAVMMALKAARAYTGRRKIAKCEGAYHGSYDYAEVSLDPTPSAWGGNAPVSVAYAKGTPENVLADVVTIPFNDVEAAVSLIREHGPELAGVLVDPMPNRAGLVPADKAYLEALRQVTREVGALLIFDEVISFRVGYHGAQGVWGIEPDLTTLGKIIGGGFPVGAIAGRKQFMSVFDPSSGKPALPHGGTFSANPVTMRAGLAAMELLDKAAFKRLDAIGQAVRDGIDAAFRRTGVPGRTVGLGSLLKIHFTDRNIRDYRSAYLNEAEAKRQTVFNSGLLNRGIFMANYGLMALSLPMSDADVDQIVSAAAASLEEVAALD